MGHVLILGATSDIAKALAYRYASEGYDLTLSARKSERLATIISDIEVRHQVAVEVVEFDALNYAGHTTFYDQLNQKPNIAICVFGYLGDQNRAQCHFSETERIINSNYSGVVSILNIIANDFEKRRAGTIIGISSVAGERGRQSNYIYGSAKAGLTAYLSGLRNRLSKVNVHVMTVNPGFVRTQMTKDLKLPRLLTASPEQVADDIFQAARQNKDTLYTLWMWRYIMLIIRNIPELIFKRLSL